MKLPHQATKAKDAKLEAWAASIEKRLANLEKRVTRLEKQNVQILTGIDELAIRISTLDAFVRKKFS